MFYKNLKRDAKPDVSSGETLKEIRQDNYFTTLLLLL